MNNVAKDWVSANLQRHVITEYNKENLFRGGETDDKPIWTAEVIDELVKRSQALHSTTFNFYNAEFEAKVQFPFLNISQIDRSSPFVARADLYPITTSQKNRGQRRSARHQKREIKNIIAKETKIGYFGISGPLLRQVETLKKAFAGMGISIQDDNILTFEELREHLLPEEFVGVRLEELHAFAQKRGYGQYFYETEGGIDILTALSEPFSTLQERVQKANQKINAFRDLFQKESKGVIVVPWIFLSGTVGNFLADEMMRTGRVRRRTERALIVRALNAVPLWRNSSGIHVYSPRHKLSELDVSEEVIKKVSMADINFFETRKAVLDIRKKISLDPLEMRSIARDEIEIITNLLKPDTIRFSEVLTYLKYKGDYRKGKRLLQITYTHNSEVLLHIDSAYPDKGLITSIEKLRGITDDILIMNEKGQLVLKAELGVLAYYNAEGLLDKILALSEELGNIRVQLTH